MLRIVPASEPLPVENIVLTIYAAPSYGKTSLAFTADNPLLLDADKGVTRACNRGSSVQVLSWDDVATLSPEDVAPYSTVIFDTAGTLIEKLKTKLIRQDPKNAGSYGGMSGKGWNNVSSLFEILVGNVIAAKKDLVIICHMDEQQKGDDIAERIEVPGKPRNTIYRLSDAMCRIQINPDGSRVLNFDPREGGYGKNPAQLPKVPFPHPSVQSDTLGKVIAQIKASLNRMTEEQDDARKESEAWNAAIAGATTADEFNLLMKMAVERKYRAPMKKELISGADAAGFVFDKDAKAFVAKAAEVAA